MHDRINVSSLLSVCIFSINTFILLNPILLSIFIYYQKKYNIILNLLSLSNMK